MEIVVLVKPVPDAETRLRADPSGRSFDPEGVKFVLAGYDESAVEQALLLKEAVPGSRVTAVSLGPAARCEEVLRSALALGCDAAVVVEAPALGPDADPIAVARGLAGALRGLPHDLVLAGKQAGDDEASLVPAAVADLLNLPSLGFATDVRFDAGSARLTLRRAGDSGVERWEAPLPCVVALQQAWNDPRTAKLPAILKSRRAPIGRSGLVADGPAPASAAAGFALPPPRTGARMIEYRTPEEAAQQLVRLLREEAKVFP